LVGEMKKTKDERDYTAIFSGAFSSLNPLTSGMNLFQTFKGIGGTVEGKGNGALLGKVVAIDSITGKTTSNVNGIAKDSSLNFNIQQQVWDDLNEEERKTIMDQLKLGNDDLITKATDSILNFNIQQQVWDDLNEEERKTIMDQLKLGNDDFTIKLTPPVPPTKPPETPPLKPSMFSTALDVINIAAWLYTIYAAIDIFTTKYKTYKVATVCNPWIAPLGGNDCERCNEKFKPCSEYKCRSLGQTCRLINPGTDEEKCINMHPNDVNSPMITPNEKALTKGYKIKNFGTNIGYEIIQKVDPYSPLSIGINTNEPSTCKYSMNASMKFDEMPFVFGSPLFLYNQTMVLTLPLELASEQALKESHGIYTLYLKCMDASGNKNNKDYFIKVKIRPGKDLTPPIIEAGSLKNNAYLANNVKQTDFSLFTNEPSTCRYSSNDVSYENMKNDFTCSESGFQTASLFYNVYECRTTLKDLKEGTNSFYFRCIDTSGNINQESFKFSLIGTKALAINQTLPAGELMDNNITLEVFTMDGAENGKAVCGYKLGSSPFIEFKNTNSNHHTEEVTLSSGTYNYQITCTDIATNEAKSEINFKIAKDVKSPTLMFVYKDEKAALLHIELDELTTCEYSTIASVKFGDGTKMTNDNSKVHEASISENSRKFFITCQDVFKNEFKFIVYP